MSQILTIGLTRTNCIILPFGLISIGRHRVVGKTRLAPDANTCPIELTSIVRHAFRLLYE